MLSSPVVATISSIGFKGVVYAGTVQLVVQGGLLSIWINEGL